MQKLATSLDTARDMNERTETFKTHDTARCATYAMLYYAELNRRERRQQRERCAQQRRLTGEEWQACVPVLVRKTGIHFPGLFRSASGDKRGGKKGELRGVRG